MFISLIPGIVATFSSTVLGFDKSSIMVPDLFFIASFILSNVTRKYGAVVATNMIS